MTQMSALAARHPLFSLYPDLSSAHPQVGVNHLGGVTLGSKAAPPWYAPWPLPHLAALSQAPRDESGNYQKYFFLPNIHRKYFLQNN